MATQLNIVTDDAVRESHGVRCRTADALAEAVDLLEEFLPADHAALVRLQDTLAAANVDLLHKLVRTV